MEMKTEKKEHYERPSLKLVELETENSVMACSGLDGEVTIKPGEGGDYEGTGGWDTSSFRSGAERSF